MILYLDGVCDSRISSIDFQSLFLKTEEGTEIDVSMETTDIAIHNGEITVRMKGISFNNEYANGKIALLENANLTVNVAVDEVDNRHVDDEKKWSAENQCYYEILLRSIQFQDAIAEDRDVNGAIHRYAIPVVVK